jgi:intracellular septation protein A
MQQKIQNLARFIFGNFGPILIFYGANHFCGLKPAIALSTAFSAIEIGYKTCRKQPITSIFKFSALMILVFGAVDLYSQQSFLFKYEASVTNLFMAVFFGATLFSEKTIIQDYYQKSKDPKPMTRDRVAYFQILTAVWVLYFLVKAGAYFWIARNYSLERGLVVRTVIGSGSLYAMLFISIVGSKKIFPLLKQWKLLPEAETT